MLSFRPTIKSYLTKGLNLSGLSLMLSLFISLAACNELSVLGGQPLNSSSFEGLESVELTSEGQLELRWAKAQDEAQHAYDVYLLKTSVLPESLSGLSLDKSGPLGRLRIN